MEKSFWPSAAYPMSTLGRLKKWLFGNIQFHLWTREINLWIWNWTSFVCSRARGDPTLRQVTSCSFSTTGKSLSEALLFAEHGENMLCTKIVLNIRNNFCTQHVLPRFELGIFMYWTCSWSKYKSFWQRFTCTHIVTCLRC